MFFCFKFLFPRYETYLSTYIVDKKIFPWTRSFSILLNPVIPRIIMNCPFLVIQINLAINVNISTPGNSLNLHSHNLHLHHPSSPILTLLSPFAKVSNNYTSNPHSSLHIIHLTIVSSDTSIPTIYPTQSFSPVLSSVPKTEYVNSSLYAVLVADTPTSLFYTVLNPYMSLE